MFKQKIVKQFAQCHVFTQSPPVRNPGDYVQSTLRSAPDLCKNISLRRCLVATVIRTQSVRIRCVYVYTHRCAYVYTHTFFQFTDAGRRQKKKKRNGTSLNAVCQGKLSTCHSFASPALIRWIPGAARVITYRNILPRLRVNGNDLHVTTLIYRTVFKQRDCFTLTLKLT